MATQEKIRHIQLLKKNPGGDGGDNTPAYANLVSRAIKGEIGTEEIADLVQKGSIKVGQAGMLMSYTTRGNSMDRSQFKTPSYMQGLSMLQGLPEKPPATMPDVDGSVGRTLALRKSLAIASYNEALMNDPKADPTAIAENIHKSETKFFNDPNGAISNPYFKMYVPKYKSREEFMNALQTNTVKPGVDVEAEKKQWNYLYTQGKGK